MAMRRRDTSAAREIFVLLLGRMERLNREWASRTIARTPSLHRDSSTTVREDLLQELTLHLWSEMAIGNDEAWEIFFTRALSFAQRHIATAFMERNGYWIAAGVRAPSRGIAIPFSRLTTRFEDDERVGDEWPQLAAPEDGMVAAELADLRELVARLPERRSAVVIMRYWQDAPMRSYAPPTSVRKRSAQVHDKLVAAREAQRLIERLAHDRRMQRDPLDALLATPREDRLHQASRESLPAIVRFHIHVHHQRLARHIRLGTRQERTNLYARASDNGLTLHRHEPAMIFSAGEYRSQHRRQLLDHRRRALAVNPAHIQEHPGAVLGDDTSVVRGGAANGKALVRHL